MARGGDGDGKANASNDTKAVTEEDRNGAEGKKPIPVPQIQYQFAQKPEELPGWEGFKKFLWNKEKREFLGRTGCSWFKIGLFYLIYYTLLTGYFIALLFIFFTTLHDKYPKWQHKDGLIGENPGLGFRPMPSMSEVESTLIYYYHGAHHTNWKEWVDRLDGHLDNYNSLMNDSYKPVDNMVECNNWGQTPTSPQICRPDVEKLFQGECTKANKYGFVQGTPCILIKLNKIYGWEPKPYKNRTLPEEAPKSLKEFVADTTRLTPEMMGNMIYVSCEGENPADKENLGEIKYYPYPGFPTHFYPFKNDKGYLSPAVFAHLTNPKLGTLISISCKAWAENIKHNLMERIGTVHFEVMID